MADQKTEVEELKELHKQSQKLRAEREMPGPDVAAAPQSEGGANRGPKTGDESPEPEDQEGIADGLTGQVQTIMAELEDAAAENPGLALLAAFGIGIFVGQLLSRR